jgi:hypothetical protein
MTKIIEVTITIGDRKITLEGPEDFVRQEVERFANAPGAGEVGVQKPVLAMRPESTDSESTSATERAFVAAKMPRGHNETVAVLGYFLTKNGHAEFSADEIRRAYIRAGVRPPKVVAQALRDAKNVNDYIERGSKVGSYKLTEFGERTVMFDLPRKGTKQ